MELTPIGATRRLESILNGTSNLDRVHVFLNAEFTKHGAWPFPQFNSTESWGDSIAWGQEKLSRGDSSLKIWTRMSFGAYMSAVGAEIIQRKCMRIASLQPVFQGRHAQVRSHSFKNERRRIVAMPWRLLR